MRICQHQKMTHNRLDVEVHRPDGGLEDAELCASEGPGGGDVGEEGLVDLGAEEEG